MMKTIRHPRFWIISVLVAVVVLASLHRLEQLEALQNRPAQPMAPLAVNVATAQRGSISRWVCGEGTVTAVRKRHLLLEASGKVVFLGNGKADQPLKEGIWVKGPEKGRGQGTFLAGLDNREVKEEIRLIRAQQAEADQELEMARATFEQAQKNLELAKSRYDRCKTLYDRKAKTLSALEEAQSVWQNALADIRTARARIKSAQAGVKGLAARYDQALIHLENTAIYAPFDGVIARLNIEEGDYFDPATVNHANEATLLATAPITLIDPGALEVTLNLPVFDGLGVAPGQKSIIRWGSMDWHPQNAGNIDDNAEALDQVIALEARVYSVSPVLSISGRSVRIKIRGQQDRQVLPHGQFVSCWIEIEHKVDSLLIPTASLLFQDDQAYVYVADQGLARRQPIAIGFSDREKVEVLEGISTGDRVVTKGRYRLFPNRPVRVINPEETLSHDT
jgi:RND family efflux transporter MFP subunit